MFKESILDPEPDVIEATKYFETMSDNIVEMVYKEEKILFPAALIGLPSRSGQKSQPGS